MQRRSFVLAIVWISILTALSAQMGDPCECYSERPPVCEAYWNYDAVFVGRIIDKPLFSWMGPGHVMVERAWKGVEPGETLLKHDGEVINCGGGGFWTGRRFLFLANRDAEGLLVVGSCDSRHWEMGTTEANEAIAFLDGLRKPSAGGRIYGNVSLLIPTFEEGEDPRLRPLKGAVVNLSGAGQTRNAPVVDGRYEITGLPAGSYEVSVTVPADMPQAFSARVPEGHDAAEAYYEPDYAPALVRTITIPDVHACSFAPFVAAFDGGITGTVLNADKTPAEGIVVEAVPASIDPHLQRFASAQATTDKDGRYRIGDLMEGRYIVGVNMRDVVTGDVPYPAVMHRIGDASEPAVSTLGAGGQIELPPLRLPAQLPTREIHGTVTLEDGTSLDDVTLEIHEVEREYESINQRQGGGHAAIVTAVNVRFDESESGAFTGSAFEGRTYVIRATRDDPRGQDAAGHDYPPAATAELRVTIRGDMDGLRLVMKPREPK